jgi:hypothetical protein
LYWVYLYRIGEAMNAKIIVEVDGNIYSEEMINNCPIPMMESKVEQMSKLLATHKQLVESGIFNSLSVKEPIHV